MQLYSIVCIFLCLLQYLWDWSILFSALLLFTGEKYFILWIQHNLFIFMWVTEFLAIVNKTAMYIFYKFFSFFFFLIVYAVNSSCFLSLSPILPNPTLCTRFFMDICFISLGWISRSGIDGSKSSCVFSFINY